MLDPHPWRQQFPALHKQRDGRLPIFLDGPGGTQVPQRVIDAMVHYLTTCNANHGGAFATSLESDQILQAAHEAMADLINAPAADEIIFGQNMTTMTFQLSRSFAKLLKPGDEVLVTRLDHDANVSPWLLAARDAGASAKWIDVHAEDCTLDLEDLRRQLGPRTRLIAVGLASNAVGTINDVATVARLAREVGARVFVDAVHYAPHGPIDVQALGCDFLACSAYKFFGPHVGVLWGKREFLEDWPAYKLRPAPTTIPGRWMTGTQNHEGIAGVAAAVEYLADLGSRRAGTPTSQAHGRRRDLVAGMTAIQEYERSLSKCLLEGLTQRPRFKTWGITNTGRLHQRVPTISITAPDLPALKIAEHLASRHIYVWSGNMYALEISQRLGLEQRGGFVRLGMVHYNTTDEIVRLLQALDEVQ